MAANLNAEPDVELLRAHLAGDPEAFAALYARYRVPSYAYLLRRCGRTLADDSFRAAWRAAASADALDAEHDFVAQLFGLAHAEVMRVAPDERVPPDQTLPELTQRTRQRAQRFERSLRQVPSNAREAYLLYEEGGLTLAEVGRILGIDAEVARERVRRALTELRTALDTDSADSTSLHDPQVAVAHLAARRTPPPTLDAVVLDEVRRAAEQHAERERARRSRLRHWPYAAAVVVGLALAQAAIYWSPRAPLPAALAVAPAPRVVPPETLPIAEPVQAPKLATVRLMPKPAPKAVRATPVPAKRVDSAPREPADAASAPVPGDPRAAADAPARAPDPVFEPTHDPLAEPAIPSDDAPVPPAR